MTLYTSDTDKLQSPQAGVIPEECKSDPLEKGTDCPDGSGNSSSEKRTDCAEDFKGSSLKTGKTYLLAALVIAAASAVYGLFSHGVQSYFMTYAFMVPLLGGAMPHLAAALKGRTVNTEPGAGDIQRALIATLTAGSLLKGALDIYGTTNRLLMVYPAIAAAIAAAFIIKKVRRRGAYHRQRSAARTGA